MIDYSLVVGKYVDAGKIAILLGDVTATEDIVATLEEARFDPLSSVNADVHFRGSGSILATLAQRDAHTAAKIWRIVEKVDPEKSQWLAAMILAYLGYLSS